MMRVPKITVRLSPLFMRDKICKESFFVNNKTFSWWTGLFWSISRKTTQSNNYWSSTTYAPNTSNAWNVNFNDGNVNNNNKTNNNYVRCVSGAWS